MGPARNLIRKALKRLDLTIVRDSQFRSFQSLAEAGYATDFLSRIPDSQAVQLLNALRFSRSQLRQDLFALSEVGFKPNGFFVEFGATNGVDLSNTYLLEKAFGWQGILAEPARCWHPALKSNRSCCIETDCVWRESNSTLTFKETALKEFSTISSSASSDPQRRAREEGVQYSVRTISLLDLLAKYDAPPVIDYLSLDTEGSEYEILRAFDFDRYQFRVITCEHNYSPQRDKIFSLLTGHGYVRKFERASAFDDWYVKPDAP